MKLRKRFLAAALSAVMILSMLPAPAFAAETAGNEETEPAAEAAAVLPAEEPEEEKAAQITEEETAAPAEEAAPEEAAAPAEDAEEKAAPEKQAQEPAAEKAAEEPAEAEAAEEPAEAEAAEEPAEAEADVYGSAAAPLTAEGSDYIVTVSYDDSALLPADTRIQVKEILESARKYDSYCDQALEAVRKEDADAEEISYIRLFDITLVDGQGNKVQPAAAVDVQISLKDIESAEDNTQVVHFGRQETEVVETEVKGDTLSFATEGFSVFAVIAPGTTGENARLLVKFMVNGELRAQMHVKKADVSEKLNEVLYDPGTPMVDNSQFMGWTDTAEAQITSETVGMTIDQVRSAVADLLNSGSVKEGDEKVYNAVMHTAYSLYYEGERDIVYKTDVVTGTGSSLTATVNYNYHIVDDTKGLKGWYVKGTDPAEDGFYKNGDPITLNGDVTLKPYIGDGAWLWFDENDGGAGAGGASYTPPVFIPVGETAKDAEPANPKRDGYGFDGWYTAAEGGTPFNFDNAVSAKTTVYAHWTATGKTTYKIIIWRQKITDAKDAADADKKYDFEETAASGEINTGNELTWDTIRPYTEKHYKEGEAYDAFQYRTYKIVDSQGRNIGVDDGSGHTKAVAGTAPIIVNVYYDRYLLTINFDQDVYTPTNADGNNLYGLVDGKYVRLTRNSLRRKYYYTNSNLQQIEYTGQRYEKTVNRFSYTGLYGQSLEQNGYTWPAGGWYGIAILSSFRGLFFKTNHTKDLSSVQDANTTIIFYMSDADDASHYTEVARANYQVDETQGFLITDRFVGADPSFYKWSDSSTMPTTGWEPASHVDVNNGRTSIPRGKNEYLHIKYDRVINNIIFMDDSGTEMTDLRISNVPYGRRLNNYVDQVPQTVDGLQEGYYFGGWYEEAELVNRVDWANSTMPSENLTVYMKIGPEEYHIAVDYDGGTSPGGELKHNTWVPYRTKLDDTAFNQLTREGYTLVGWYTDKARTKRWNFDTEITKESLSILYDDSQGEDERRKTVYYGETELTDEGYRGTVGVLTLYPKWSDDSVINAGGIEIQYKNADGAPDYSYTDSLHYADQADVTAAAAVPEDKWPSGKEFAGWNLNGTIYDPTDVFAADKSLAESVNGKLIITLKATYKDTEEKTPTHINWYKNDGSNEIYRTDQVPGVNEAVKIFGLGTGESIPNRTDYRFLGWAKAEEATGTSLNVTAPNFLEYKNGKYYTVGESSVQVTEVAADEVRPYEALYAVWKEKEYFYIYHSATEETEKVEIPENGTFDLTGKVETGYFYGGYFHYENSTKGTPYTENGKTDFRPQKNQTYYLKEVDTGYLRPALYLTYNPLDNNKIENLYGFINVDAANDYSGFGLEIAGKRISMEGQPMASSQIVVTRGGVTYDTLTPSKLFGQTQAEFGYTDISDVIAEGATVQITGYYITCDGFKVTGCKDRMIQFTNDLTFTGWNSAGNTRCGLKSVTSTMTAESQPASPAGLFSVLRSLTLSAPAPKAGYTITKIYSSGAKEEQTVEKGDRTGEIEYVQKKNYTFAGWYMDKDYKKAADFSNVASDMTVYAKYIKNTNITLTLQKKSVSGTTTKFNASVTVKNKPCAVRDVKVTATYKKKDKTGKLSSRSVTKSGTKANIKYTTRYSGTVSIKGLAKKDSFTAVISWVTPDGTKVTLNAKKCTYKSGKVTVK